MKKQNVLTLCAAAVLAALVAGCAAAAGGAAREIKTTATEMKFEPAVIEVRAGEKVRFTDKEQGMTGRIVVAR